jgi:antitoxin component YwqK of YwqJK toxin-antitoxin module
MSKFICHLIVLPLFIIVSCSQNNELPPTTLELRDTLIYKKGSDIPFTGKEKARVENKIIEYDILNGVRHGEFKLYYESGKLEIKGQLENNMNVGKWQYFYESGQVESEGLFVKNMPEGKWKWYYRSGNLREEGTFEEGARVGMWTQFDDYGNILEENDFPASDSTDSPLN